MTARSAVSSLAAASCLLALLLASGCTGVGGKPKTDPAEAKALWEVFHSQALKPPTSFTLTASLTLTAPNKSSRVMLRFWGDLDRPLRLDISTSMGQLYTMWREDDAGWLAVYPLSNQAFTHTDTRKAVAKLGVPLPLNLKDFAMLVSGRYAAILPQTFTSAVKKGSGYEYALPVSSPIATVTLDFLGNPIHLTGRGVEPWSVDLSDFSRTVTDRRAVADKIQLTTPGGATLLLRVKSLEVVTGQKSKYSLDLELPPNARVTPLEKAQDVKAPEMP